MRAAITSLAVVLCLGAAAMVPVAASAAANPSQSQIRAAVQRAVRSKSLWATVNICNSHRYPDYLGVRGQMPSLGFAAWLSMRVQLLYYNAGKKSYLPVPSRGSKLIRLGRSSAGLQQAGALFQFAPHQPTLRATVQFVWRRSGRLLGQTTLDTSGGHRGVDFSSPPHYSAKQCRII